MITRYPIRVAFALLLFVLAVSVSYAEPAKPNILILFSNDRTATMPAYPAMTTYDNATDYYGYFDPNKYYEYQKNAGFVPKGWTADHYDPKLRHYVPTGTDTFWSGNFLNWATMSHIDQLRKQLTGGKRGADNSDRTTLIRMALPYQSAFQKAYKGADLNRLVPAAYANALYAFRNEGTALTVVDSTWGRLVSPEMTVEVTVCERAMPEHGCSQYDNVWKPEGLIQHYKNHLNFGLMSHTKAQMTEGGVLRVPIGPVVDEFSQKSGMLASGDGIINVINDISLERGWSPTAELYYDALRYLKGNEAGQQAYCGADETKKEDGFDIVGCDANHLWVDPMTDPCQKTSILLVTDEWPSKDSNALPFSAFNPGYVDTPMPFGSNIPFNPDVTALTDIIGETEALNRTPAYIGNVIGNEDNNCYRVKYLTSLGAARGLCRDEGMAEGSFYTAGLAYEAFTGDLRPDLPGRQSVNTYVLTYSASPGGNGLTPKPNPLMLTAKYGNFRDRNYSGLPDTNDEWMKNANGCMTFDLNTPDCQPKGFYYVRQGVIAQAITAVFERDIGENGICDNVGDSDGDGIVDLDDPYPFDPNK